MTAHLNEEKRWAAGVAARLRILQASFADDEPATREGFLIEAVQQAMKEVPGTQHQSHLAALRELFPIPVPQAELPVAAPAPRSAPATPSDLASQILELPADQRQTVIGRLQAAGAIPAAAAVRTAAPAPGGPAPTLPHDVVALLELPEGRSLDLARSVKLLAGLSEFYATLDQLVWSVWKSLAPRSVVRREASGAELRETVRAFLAGDPEVSTAQLTEVIDKTRQLTAGLLAAIGATGETFARQYLSRFSPAAIKQSVGAEGGSFLIGAEQKCWRKYVEIVRRSQRRKDRAGDRRGDRPLHRATDPRLRRRNVRNIALTVSSFILHPSSFQRCPPRSTGTKAFSSSRTISSVCRKPFTTNRPRNASLRGRIRTASSRRGFRMTSWKTRASGSIDCAW